MNKNTKNYTKGAYAEPQPKGGFCLFATCAKGRAKSAAKAQPLAALLARPSLKGASLKRKGKTNFLVKTQKSAFSFKTNTLDNNLSSTNKTALKALALRRSPKSFTKIVVPKKPTVKFEESAQNMDTPFSTKKPIYKKKLFPKKLTSSSQITSKDILKVGTAAFRHNLYKSFMGKVTVALQISTQMRNQKGPDIQKENKKVKETYKQGLRLGAKRLKQRRKNLQKYTQEIKGASRKLLPRHKVLKSRSPRLDFSLRFQIRNTAVSPKDSRFKDLYVRLTKRVKAWYKGSLLESRSLLNASPLPSLLPDSSFRHSPDLHQLIHGKELMGPTFVGVLERNKILNPFLYGRTGALEILDIDFLIPQMKRVRTLLLLTFLRKGNILIISNDPLHSQILQEVSKRSKRLLVVSRWTHGLLTNWKQVQPHFFQKHNKKELLKDTKKYLKLCNRDRKKIHQKSTSIEFARFKKRNLKKNKNLKKKILYLKILKWRKTRNLKSHRFTKMPSKKALRGKDFLKKKRILYLKILKWRKTRNLKSHRFTKVPSKKALRSKDFLKKKGSSLVSRSKKKKKLALRGKDFLKKKKILYLKVLKWRKTRNLKSHRFTKVPSKKALRCKDFLKKKRSFLVSRSKKKKKLALPTFVVVIDPDEHQDAILEARKIKIPTISFLPLGAKAHSVDYLLPVPGELTDYLYWFCQQLVNWKHQAKQMAFDLEEIFQKKKLQRKQKIRRILQIKKKARNKKKKSLRILKAVAQKRLFSPLAKQRTAQPHL